MFQKQYYFGWTNIGFQNTKAIELIPKLNSKFA
jgi:hypothetical protein